MSGAAKFKNNVKVSERHGAGEWLIERILLVALLPLGLWVASTGFTLAGAGYDAAMAWFANPLNAALMAITAVIFFGYVSLAWKVILEDYVPSVGTRGLLVLLLNVVFLVLAAASVFFIVRLALGSAPLPAGFGA
ncbi:succinate dehydrogenase / fumarate reductase membrane anchor subunit [Brevundimonas vesicularis]|uniref:succinate dehydrogenase, hydrophobic membrane anchor protein n=1 Tax=Brevundimonas TaxID=41275 RepID=UPI000886A031|nr:MULTISPECIES: succinate dehydrogenase, hydrophobic membrane anchor protein [Brevundimonas]MDQ1194218.1 succinate dehydrogenase / fumarate reductase membrane anchor subunit [Brevundimonas vesicularis]QIF80546.1 succinate dehydrogenase, hydrophobic membrane anchor protein [Brevundimonas sp. 'scallop']SDR11490.1 succinate dehydrogenase / fumarate reductase membrane anchor subunit [Brevundimonas sp. 374]